MQLHAPTHPQVPARQAGWPRRFDELVQLHLGLPFEWGRNDCCSFAADVVMALHCADTLAPLRVPRHNALQAVRQIRAADGTAVLQRCGLPLVGVAHARVADLVLVVQDARRRRALLAVCNGADALAPGRQGLEALPMRCAIAAWRT